MNEHGNSDEVRIPPDSVQDLWAGGGRYDLRMKVLLGGGAGYVGSGLVDELLSRAYAVRVFDRLYYEDQGLRSGREPGGPLQRSHGRIQSPANHEMNTAAAAALARKPSYATLGNGGLQRLSLEMLRPREKTLAAYLQERHGERGDV